MVAQGSKVRKAIVAVDESSPLSSAAGTLENYQLPALSGDEARSSWDVMKVREVLARPRCEEGREALNLLPSLAPA
jgi:hypothetical protein